MIKGVIVGLIWGIVTISVVVVAFGIGNPPEQELAQPDPDAVAPTAKPAEAPKVVIASPDAEPAAREVTKPAAPVVVAEPAPDVALPDVASAEQVASLSPPAGSAFTAEKPDFTPFIPRQDSSPAVTAAPAAQMPTAEAPAVPVIAQSAEPPVIAEAPDDQIVPDAADEAKASVSSAAVAVVPSMQIAAQPQAPAEDAGLTAAATQTAKEPERIATAPEISTVPPVPAQPGSGESAPEIVALPAPAVLPQVTKAVTLQTQDNPDSSPAAEITSEAVPKQIVSTQTTESVGKPLPKRLEMESGRAPIVQVEAAEAESEAAEPPKSGFRRVVPGVRTDRLPRIETTPTPATADAPSGDLPPDMETALEPVPTPVLPGQPRVNSQIPDADPGALARNAVPFNNDPPLPLIAVILTPGDGGVDPESLKVLPFPVSVALDPNAPDVAATAEAYRQAGAEVLILPVGLPKRGTASDIEVSFATFTAAIPTAVGVIDLPVDGFAANMLGAKQVAAILGADGYGMVTYGRGLNSAAQEAAKLSVPAAEVMRVLDDGGASESVVRRNLDRAAFDAVQSGGTVAVATASPEMLAALSAWALDAKTARLAPVSAVLSAR